MAEGGALRVCSARLCAPVPGAAVRWLGGSDEEVGRGTTDERGALSGEIPDGARSAEVSHPGFESKRVDLESGPPKHIRLLERELAGYQLRPVYRPGDTVSARVHSREPYRATLYRHGAQRTEILRFEELAACRQSVPDAPFVADGLGWSESFTYTLPEDLRSGLYSLRLESAASPPHAIPMVVLPSQETGRTPPPLLVLANTLTWQCYNLWGGRSRYHNYETDASDRVLSAPMSTAARRWRRRYRALPGIVRNVLHGLRASLVVIKPEWIHMPLSAHRPNIGCDLLDDDPDAPFSNHLAAGEWRLLAWLEREGIDYDLVDDAALEREPNLLDAYRAVIVSTHSEYWTRAMFDRLAHHHRNRGLWILNLSGNSIQGEVARLDGERIRLVDPIFRVGDGDQSALIAVNFEQLDFGTCAGFVATQPEHWAFEGAPLDRRNPTFGSLSLNRDSGEPQIYYEPGLPGLRGGLVGAGASGWETDRLTGTAPADARRIARGLNPGGGADMVVREPRAPRGGLFSASSITFGGALSIDSVVAGICRNAIRHALESG